MLLPRRLWLAIPSALLGEPRRVLGKSAGSVCILFAFFAVGCVGTPLGAKRWSGGTFGQGSVDRQKGRSVYFDPYPLNDIGPEVVGGRPPGFMNPLPEARRNELPR